MCLKCPIYLQTSDGARRFFFETGTTLMAWLPQFKCSLINKKLNIIVMFENHQ